MKPNYENACSEVKALLHTFQDGYLKRNPDFIQSFMQSLFNREQAILIIGTSDNEWYFDYEGAERLFLSDWESWGDFRLDTDNPIIKIFGNTAFVHAKASVKYTFTNSNEVYDSFVDFIKEYFNGTSYDSQKPIEIKVSEINWFLCHLLSQREDSERVYRWKANLTLILSFINNQWTVRQIQFSIPAASHYPDERIYAYDYYQKAYENELEKLKKHASSLRLPQHQDFNRLLGLFVKDLLDGDKKHYTVADQYFSDEDPVIIAPDGSISREADSLFDFIARMRTNWDTLQLNLDEALVSGNDDILWLGTTGIARKEYKDRSLLDKTETQIKALFESPFTSKDKLFRIRRTIADSLKEMSKGDTCIWPVRFEALLQKKEKGWQFQYLQLSYPFNCIIEEKTDEIISD